MIPETAALVRHLAVLLLLLLAVYSPTAQPTTVDIPPWAKHDAANLVIGSLFFSARMYNNALCGSDDRALRNAESMLIDFYKADKHALTPTAEKSIKIDYIGAGMHGVVFLVKVDGVMRAMKVTKCGAMQAEIYAQQKLVSAPWAIEMHGWGRSSETKPKWEYYIMDQIGATLEDAVKAGGVDAQQLQEVIRLILEAAKDLHTYYGLAHTDLKSDNVAFMLGEDQKIKLIDFGLVELVTADNAIAAYSDFWRVTETINGFKRKAFPRGGAEPIYKILTDEAATQIFDGKPLGDGQNGFPKKTFFDFFLHGKVMDRFVELGWIDKTAQNKKETVLEKLFSKLA